MRKFNVIAAICGLGLGFAVATPAAQASTFSTFSLIDPVEGEVKLTNFEDGSMEAIDSGELIDLGFSVTSLDYEDNGYDTGFSRLFIDKKGTENTYGDGLIRFGTRDAGTNEAEGEYWLRAVATDSNGNPIEGGELEVGLFTFDFGEVVERIDLEFFDTESGNTGITSINGTALEDIDYLEAGADGNIQIRTLENVSSFTVKLGQKSATGTGDGVTLTSFQSTTNFAKSVPEPTTTISLGALAVAGMFGVKKRKKLNK